MLKMNRMLESPTFTASEEFFHRHREALMLADGLELPNRPLNPSQQYAFLSVVQHFRSSMSTQPVHKRLHRANGDGGVDFGRLDSLAIELIFDFAATKGAARTLRIDTYDPGNAIDPWMMMMEH